MASNAKIHPVDALVDYYGFAVNEQCFEYSECDLLKPFIGTGKTVLNAEYLATYMNNVSARSNLCVGAGNRQFSTLVLPLNLADSFRYSCNCNCNCN